MSFLGATGTPVLHFWWCLLWVSKPEWLLPYSHCRCQCDVHSPRSTSGATHADLLAASLPPVLSLHTVAEVRLQGFELVLSKYLWFRRSTNWAKLWRDSMNFEGGRSQRYCNQLPQSFHSHCVQVASTTVRVVQHHCYQCETPWEGFTPSLDFHNLTRLLQPLDMINRSIFKC